MSSTVDLSKGSLVIPPDSIAAGVMQAEASTQSLRDVTSLRDAALDVFDVANSTGCFNLVAVNAAAEPLATAAALLSNGKLAWSDQVHSTADKVLIIDAATVTGSLTRACASELREKGASWVGAIIYDRVRPDLDGLDDETLLDFVASVRGR